MEILAVLCMGVVGLVLLGMLVAALLGAFGDVISFDFYASTWIYLGVVAVLVLVFCVSAAVCAAAMFQ